MQFAKALHELKERLLPRPFERIALAGRQNLIGAEVGVFEGEHAKTMLRTADIKLLYLVDPYEPYTDGTIECNSDDVCRAYRRADRKLKPWRKHCQWVLKRSNVAADHVANELDFVYIDGNHTRAAVEIDLETWWPKVRHEGILGGHDFSDVPGSEHPGVILAVTDFALAQNLRLHVCMSDWWFEKP